MGTVASASALRRDHPELAEEVLVGKLKLAGPGRGPRRSGLFGVDGRLALCPGKDPKTFPQGVL